MSLDAKFGREGLPIALSVIRTLIEQGRLDKAMEGLDRLIKTAEEVGEEV